MLHALLPDPQTPQSSRAQTRSAARVRERDSTLLRMASQRLLLALAMACGAAAHPDFLDCSSRELAVGGPAIMSRTPVASANSIQIRPGSASGSVLVSGSDVVIGQTLFVTANIPSNHDWHVRVEGASSAERDCSSSRTSTTQLQVSTAGFSPGAAVVKAGHTSGSSSNVQVIEVPFNLVTPPPTLAPSAPPTVSRAPSASPTVSSAPSWMPSARPTGLVPTALPSQAPNAPPTSSPSWSPSEPKSCVSVSDLARGSYEFCYVVAGDRLEVEITAGVSQGYIGWAVSGSSRRMDGSDAVIATGSDTVLRYILGDHAVGGPLDAAGQDLEGTSLERSGGQTVVRFSRSLNATFGGKAVDPLGDNDFIIAIGASDAFSSHGGGNRVGLRVNLLTGEASVEDETDEMIVLHAVLMCLAWMLFAPLGVLSSVFRAYVPGEGLWLKLHATSNVAAVLLNLAGFVVIVLHVEGLELQEGGHHLLGFVIFIFANLQVLAGALRPHAPEAGEARSWARLAFEIGHKSMGFLLVVLAHVNVLSGLKQDAVVDGEDYEAVPVAFLVAFLVIVVFQKLRQAVYPETGVAISGPMTPTKGGVDI